MTFLANESHEEDPKTFLDDLRSALTARDAAAKRGAWDTVKGWTDHIIYLMKTQEVTHADRFND